MQGFDRSWMQQNIHSNSLEQLNLSLPVDPLTGDYSMTVPKQIRGVPELTS